MVAAPNHPSDDHEVLKPMVPMVTWASHQVARPITILQRPVPNVTDDGVATDPAVQLLGPAKSMAVMAVTAAERLVGRHRGGFHGGSCWDLLRCGGGFKKDPTNKHELVGGLEHFFSPYIIIGFIGNDHFN